LISQISRAFEIYPEVPGPHFRSHILFENQGVSTRHLQ
jgi:hypothetical protein